MSKLRISYPFDGSFVMDKIAESVVGRWSNYSGCGMGQRDLGWYTENQEQAIQHVQKLVALGFRIEVCK